MSNDYEELNMTFHALSLHQCGSVSKRNIPAQCTTSNEVSLEKAPWKWLVGSVVASLTCGVGGSPWDTFTATNSDDETCLVPPPRNSLNRNAHSEWKIKIKTIANISFRPGESNPIPMLIPLPLTEGRGAPILYMNEYTSELKWKWNTVKRRAGPKTLPCKDSTSEEFDSRPLAARGINEHMHNVPDIIHVWIVAEARRTFSVLPQHEGGAEWHKVESEVGNKEVKKIGNGRRHRPCQIAKVDMGVHEIGGKKKIFYGSHIEWPSGAHTRDLLITSGTGPTGRLKMGTGEGRHGPPTAYIPPHKPVLRARTSHLPVKELLEGADAAGNNSSGRRQEGAVDLKRPRSIEDLPGDVWRGQAGRLEQRRRSRARRSNNGWCVTSFSEWTHRFTVANRIPVQWPQDGTRPYACVLFGDNSAEVIGEQ
ncbi:hypothetical protein C8R43DRAFT_940385 [Mycena crocata]|nr:hypothetical protein C8R43DRAFT_940385 [Mycena crocata]